MTRKRIDILLAERGLFESRERAKAAVLAGDVRVNGQVVWKAGETVSEDAPIEVAERRRFVSRGGDKLAGALAAFAIDVTGRAAIDVGASTGGFTDCLLQEGASSVVALDVGYGQLAWQLRQDPRVTVHERTNVRGIDPEELGAPFDIVVCDVSFIALKKVLPQLDALAGDRGEIVALVKPQFEAGKGNVGKRGVVKDMAVHAEVLAGVCAAIRERGLVVRGLTFSPIKGPEGNIEFWVWASRSGVDVGCEPESIAEEAHKKLGV